MGLSAKQIALFGQVKVNMVKSNSNLQAYVTLLELYNAGWWITERFGTIITIVKPRFREKDGFSCVAKRIITDINLDSLDIQWKLIADKKYQIYKHRLQKRLKQDESYLSPLSDGD